MKNLTKLIGIIALVVVIGFSFTACGEEEDDNGDDGGGGGGVFTTESGVRMECSGDLGNANWNDAVTIARNYRGGGKTDWRLPDINELNSVYENLHEKGLGGFKDGYYWSSRERGSSSRSATRINFITGGWLDFGKEYDDGRVLAVRKL